MTTIDNITSLLARINELKLNIVLLISDVAAATQFAFATADYETLQKLITEFQAKELAVLLDCQVKLGKALEDLKLAAQVSGEQQDQANKSLAELQDLHQALIKFFQELSQRSEASFANSAAKLEQALANQQSLQTYFQYLNSLKNLYKGILGFDQVPLPATGPVASPVQFPVISRFNEQYFCQVTYAHRDAQYVKLSFDVRGDMSLGELQNPLDSKIFCKGLVYGVAEHWYEVEDAKSNYRGTLLFKVVDLPDEPVLFAYGSSGYSAVVIA